MRRIVLLLSIIALSTALLSCHKEPDTYEFHVMGSTHEFHNIDITPKSLLTTDGIETQENRNPPTDDGMNSQCTAWISWVHATYFVNRHMLLISAEENDTGKTRYCIVTATNLDGTPFLVKFTQKAK